MQINYFLYYIADKYELHALQNLRIDFSQHLKTTANITEPTNVYFMAKKCLKSETEKESGQCFMTFLERHKQTCMYLR